ncbi:hypothetical protein FLX56_00895 [Synechococcus moorigangaii CMS01]|nr:hypothetical protein [Synechococcus moorigangaii CMS01]
MKWIGRIFLILFLLLAGFLAVSAGLAYVAGQGWREAALAERVERLDAHFEAAIMDRIEASTFDDEDCIWIGEARDIAAGLFLENSARRIEIELAEREACGVRLGADELRSRRVEIEQFPWSFGYQPVPLAFVQDTVEAAMSLLTADANGVLRYQYAQRRRGLLPATSVLAVLPADELELLLNGFLDGHISAQHVGATSFRDLEIKAEAWRALALENAFHSSSAVQERAFYDLYYAVIYRNSEAIWYLTNLWRGQWSETPSGPRPFALASPILLAAETDAEIWWLRYAVARGHAEATRAFLENGWNRQGEDGNGDGIVWNDPFSTPYWWAVHAVRLDDPAFAADLDAAMAHLEAQGCADHAHAVGEAWRGVLADFWSDHTPINALILERPDCAGPQDSEPAEFEHSDSRFDDPLYDLPELMIALDLSL